MRLKKKHGFTYTYRLNEKRPSAKVNVLQIPEFKIKKKECLKVDRSQILQSKTWILKAPFMFQEFRHTNQP